MHVTQDVRRNSSAMSAPNGTLLDCSLVNELGNSSEARCLLLHALNDCDTGRGLLPYIDLLYCWPTWGYWPLALLFLWLVTLFVTLGSTASSYLCPALVVISKSMQLSQSITGVTLLAFGNGAPDAIATIASIRSNRTALAIGELFGGGTYVATVVVGLIFISNDFDVIPSSLLRDVFFYLIVSYWVFVLYLHKSITVGQAASFIVLYLVYITVAVFGPSLITACRRNRSRVASVLHERSISTSTSSGSPSRVACIAPEDTEESGGGDALQAEDTVASPIPFARRPSLRRTFSGVSLHHHHENAISFFTTSVEESDERFQRDPPQPPHESPSRPAGSATVFSGEETPLLGSRTEPRAEYGEWTELLLQLCPAEPHEWNTKHPCCKLYDVLTLPIHLALVLTVPVVDPHNRRTNWCRPLNALQCVTSPILTLSVFGATFVNIGGLVPLWALVLVFGLALATAVRLTSAAQEPPSYHGAFAYAGFVVSVVWIYGIATEIVALLKAFGVLSGISDVLLGMTVLAWGNNIGDLVTNLSLAKQGFPQMAMSACFAGPVFALLLGTGVAFSINFVSQGLSVIELQYSDLLTIIYVALVAGLILLLFSMIATWFRSSRAVGVMLIVLYLSLLLITFLVEFRFLSAVSRLFSPLHR
ncbi:mitochondrial sodium/calcium exchanger protein-like [Ixodes scapularis]